MQLYLKIIALLYIEQNVPALDVTESVSIIIIHASAIYNSVTIARITANTFPCINDFQIK